MKSFFGIFILGAVTMAGALPAETLEPGTHARTFISTYDGSEEPYNLFIPKVHEETEAKLPLVVVLHGWGANWKSWFAATQVREWAEKEGYIVIAPHGRGNWFYRGPGERDVLDSMEDVKKLARVDEERIYLMGHSMGGWGTWHLGCSYPDKWAAIVPMSAWAPMERLENLRYVPVYTIHGDNDDAVDVNETRRAAARMKELHDQAVAEGKPDHYINKYDEIPGGTHDSALISEMFPAIGDFLRGKTVKKSEDVWEINMVANVPHRGKAYWLEILVNEEYISYGRIHAEIKKLSSPERGHRLYFTRDNVSWSSFVRTKLPTKFQNSRVRISYGSGLAEYDSIWMSDQPRSYHSTGFFHCFDPPYVGKFENPPDLPSSIIKMVENEADSALVLIPRHHLAPYIPEDIITVHHVVEITVHHVVDMYLRGDDGLQIVEIGKIEYSKLVELSKDWPGWWGLELDEEFPGEEGETIRVVFPENIAYKIPFEPKEQVEFGIRKAIYNYLVRERKFPVVEKEGEG